MDKHVFFCNGNTTIIDPALDLNHVLNLIERNPWLFPPGGFFFRTNYIFTCQTFGTQKYIYIFNVVKISSIVHNPKHTKASRVNSFNRSSLQIFVWGPEVLFNCPTRKHMSKRMCHSGPAIQVGGCAFRTRPDLTRRSGHSWESQKTRNPKKNLNV